MSEIDSSPENPKIPEQWDFPEKNNPELKGYPISTTCPPGMWIS